MNDATRLAIAAEVATLLEPLQIEEGEFTVADYVEAMRLKGEDVSPNTVAGRLRRAAENGTLSCRQVQTERSTHTWAYRRVEPCDG